MRRAVALAVLVLMATAARAGAQATTSRYKEFAQGANVTFSPNCPYDSLPSVDTVCDDWTVWYYRSNVAIDGGPAGRRPGPLRARLEHEVSVLHPDGTGDTLSFEYGEAPTTGTYDAARMSGASMAGAMVQMNSVDLVTGAETPNGTTHTIGPFTWTPSGPVQVFGNDGPEFGGLPRHLHDPCSTLNAHAHQRFRLGPVTGSLDGVPLSDFYELPGAVFNNWFHVGAVTHC